MAEKTEDRRGFFEKYGSAVTPVLVTAIFSITGVIATNVYQSKTAATQLISEREKAESDLRASMFKDLIGPIIGDPRNIPPERERLLVELLALNFGEHFELKPLLREADKKIMDAMKDKHYRNRPDFLEQEREALRSVARRVSTRQIAMLLNQGTGEDKTVITPLAFIKWEEDGEMAKTQEQIKQEYLKTKQVATIGTGESIRLGSPDKKNTVLVSINSCDWKKQLCTVHINLLNEGNPSAQTTGASNKDSVSSPNKDTPYADLEFEFSWFDFPLNDNTLLADGNRFALVMQALDPEFRTVAVDLVWFPKVYFSPRERPINYADIRKKLSIEAGK